MRLARHHDPGCELVMLAWVDSRKFIFVIFFQVSPLSLSYLGIQLFNFFSFGKHSFCFLVIFIHFKKNLVHLPFVVFSII